jgi:hypothetical protein
MSIIYGTLERLESDDPALMHNSEQASSMGKAVETRGLPIKALVTALLLAMTGANLLLWYWSNEVGAPQYPTPAERSSDRMGSRSHEHHNDRRGCKSGCAANY